MTDAIGKAYEIYGDLENSMSDMARCVIDSNDYDKIEAEADRIWNDPKELRDIMGDKIFWASKSLKDKEHARDICLALSDIGHSAIKEAVKFFMEDHKLDG